MSAKKSDTVGRQQEQTIQPRVDVVEDAGGITLFADLPGVTKEQVGVHLEGDTLTVEGHSSVAYPEGLQITHAEHELGTFRRTFTLSRELDTNRISADMSQGVLRLRIPKAEKMQPRKVEVKVL